jgi:hypothetical protein
MWQSHLYTREGGDKKAPPHLCKILHLSPNDDMETTIRNASEIKRCYKKKLLLLILNFYLQEDSLMNG